jgi:fatty acid desaturase
LAVHLGWALLTWFSAALPWWVLAPLGAFVVAWHGSFQHETIHGHPTRSRTINGLFGSLPIALWLPYGVYRAQHVEHHRAKELTDPLEDPESFYVTADAWAAAGPIRRAWLHVQMTAVGRLLLGPATVMARFLLAEARRLLRGDRSHLRAWAAHLVGVALVLVWVTMVCHLSLGRYLLCFVYPGTGLALLRSFTEHRPAQHAAERTAIVESGWLFSLLYLNNNLHVVHHDEPALPWYEIPKRYRATRDDILAENGQFAFDGYSDVIRRYAFRPKDSPMHPMNP